MTYLRCLDCDVRRKLVSKNILNFYATHKNYRIWVEDADKNRTTIDRLSNEFAGDLLKLVRKYHNKLDAYTMSYALNLMSMACNKNEMSIALWWHDNLRGVKL